MKRTSLTTAVIAGIAGVAGISNMASAVYLNNDGLGQVLIYPYYTVNAGNITLMTVVNTTNDAKAVKVRFLEAYNSREVLDFNLYLSKHDVWTAAVVKVGSGAGVFSTDNSCTVPALPTTAASAQPFLTYAYDGTGGTDAGGTIPADGGPTSVTRTLEGYAELIEMGTVVGSTAASITHKNGVPDDCTVVQDLWADGGDWTTDSTIDMSGASGGLFGSGAILNVNEGTIAGYNADAIDQFYLAGDFNHSAPGSLSPSLADEETHTSYVFAPSPSTTVPTLITTPYITGVDAISSLFRRSYPSWTMQLNVTYPLGTSSADANVARARVQQNQVQAQLKQIELQIATDITNAATSVQNNVERVDAAKAARELAQRTLEAEQSKFEVGMSTNYLVVQSQRDLATAQNNELQSILNYRNSIVELERLQQTTLGNLGITVISSATR